LIGGIGNGVSAFIYHYFENHLKITYRSTRKVLGWCHLILTNVGISALSLTMIYAGYVGDLAMFPPQIEGGLGMNAKVVSQNIMNPFIGSVSIMLLVSSMRAICGGTGFIISFMNE
jgi:hypothetical protein